MDDDGIDFDPVPILELEPEAMYAFLRQMNLADLVVFSLLSPQCAEHVKNANVDIAPLTLEVNSRGIQISLKRREFDHHWAYWFITAVTPENYNEWPTNIYIGDRWMKYSRLERTRNWVKLVPHDQFLTKFLAIQHTRALLQNDVSTVTFNTTNYHGFPQLWTALPPFSHALIGGTNNPAHIALFFQSTTIEETLLFQGSFCSIKDHFDRFSSLRDITIQVPCPWFELKHLARLNCQTLTVVNANIDNEQLRRFVNRWRNSTMRQFKTITLTPYEGHYDPQQICEGTWERLNVRSEYRHSSRLYEINIQRPIDESVMLIGLGYYKVYMEFTYTD